MLFGENWKVVNAQQRHLNFDLLGGGVGGFNPHWMRTTSTVVAENFGLGVGFDPSRPVPTE